MGATQRRVSSTVHAAFWALVLKSTCREHDVDWRANKMQLTAITLTGTGAPWNSRGGTVSVPTY